MLDTYWSDHCRHTTFLTELTDVSFGEGMYAEPISRAYEEYKADFDKLYENRPDKYVCLYGCCAYGHEGIKGFRKTAGYGSFR